MSKETITAKEYLDLPYKLKKQIPKRLVIQVRHNRYS